MSTAATGRVLDRLGDDSDQEPGGSQGKNAYENRVPDIARDAGPVIHVGGERGQQVNPGDHDEDHADDDTGDSKPGEAGAHVILRGTAGWSRRNSNRLTISTRPMRQGSG